MGKHNRKMKRAQQDQKKNEIRQETKVMKTEIIDLLNKEEYDKVLEKLAKMIQAKCYDAETMYAGAFSYFMLNDYKRASDWVNNTLAYDPQNIDARILLARICFLEDRVTDGLAICNFVMQYYSNVLTNEQKTDIEDLANMYISDDGIEQNNYPYLLQLVEAEANTATVRTEDVLLAKEAAKKNTPAKKDEKIEAVVNSANESLEISKAKCQEIMRQPISLTDKIKLLNSFAAGFYLNKDFAGAELLLTEALHIDTKCDATLRNMTMTQLALGKKEKAQEFAAEMAMPDFVLLEKLK